MASIKKRFHLANSPGSFGVSCTTEGVSLAGVPLLRKTIAGLAPRPMDELTALMKSAYGRDMDSIRPYPGLDVIAQALNQGNVGRAMVATIQLRLPDLNEEGAARIASVAEALHKYDSNEPRDERGRWTTSGESSPNASAPPATQMRPILVSNFDGPGDFPPGPLGLASIGSQILNLDISRQCVAHAQEPRYYEKTQACAAVSKQCGWLIDTNARIIFRKDACLWPDGAAAIMRMGVLVKFKEGF